MNKFFDYQQLFSLRVALVVTILVALLVLLCTRSQVSPVANAARSEPGSSLPQKVTFNAHIRPIMSNTCFACHGPDEESNDSGFKIDTFTHATGSLPSDEELVGIKPGEPMESEVYLRIIGKSETGDVMPPEDFRHGLSYQDKELFRLWIEQGAEYEQHWSYAPIERPDVPTFDAKGDWVANPIDAFVLERLEQEGLHPSPPADRATLLRRVSLDLTGLPPTVDQLKEYLADESDDAYERVVDRLLASPHYGERMASFWLDLVRFADTVGFHGDQNQRIFPYRDYVISALNDNMPFDQFTREQLAGDLLPSPSQDQLVATGFLRLNMMTREGGAQPGEYLAKYRADRVRALGTVWLGSTLGCCECHNHKYDPFTSRDFYSLGAFFDDLRQWGVYSDYGYTPNKDLAGFTNDYPFPPEIRIDSESLRREILVQQQKRDYQLLEELGSNVLKTPVLEQWTGELENHLRSHPSGWTKLRISDVGTTGDSQTELQEDDSVLLLGTPQSGEVVTVSTRVPHKMAVNSVRVEVLPDERNNNNVGRAGDGRFTIHSFCAALDDDPDNPDSSVKVENRPRYVRLDLTGNNRVLLLAELEVLVRDEDGQLKNIAYKGEARQSSIQNELGPEKAIDGNTDGDPAAGNSATHTKYETNPWWELDLGSGQEVEMIRIWNRTDRDVHTLMKGLQLSLFDENHQLTLIKSLSIPEPSLEVELPKKVYRKPLFFAWTQADRRNPLSYQGGHEPPNLSREWRSGPIRWQLPKNEAQLPHTAVFHLSQPMEISPDESLYFEIESSDVGRLRLSVTPLGHAIAGWDAADERLQDAVFTDAQHRTTEHNAVLVSAYHRSTVSIDEQSPTSRLFRDEILQLRSGKAMSLVAQALPHDAIPVTRVLPRGDWQDESGEVTPPGFPEFLPGMDSDQLDGRRLSRLDLANWVTSAENPLTPRHFVNRTWKQFFGIGLSGKLDDLGSQGEWPSHPRLVDWLASEFVRSGWNVKHLVRLIVTSNTYRQAAAVRDDLAKIDPYNRLLAQQSPRRLEAEIVRDNALSISGLLVTDLIGGPSVFPYQPKGYYRDIQFPNRTYQPSEDWRQYRRGLYMHWQRTFLHPMLVNFDAPSRDECAADRPLSNSPQQALTLLNDPTFIEASNALAAALIIEYGIEDFSEFLDNAFLRALARRPSAEERAGLVTLHHDQLKYFRSHPVEAAKVLEVGMASEFPDVDSADLAAYAQVCRVILNLHETITRY